MQGVDANRPREMNHKPDRFVLHLSLHVSILTEEGPNVLRVIIRRLDYRITIFHPTNRSLINQIILRRLDIEQ